LLAAGILAAAVGSAYLLIAVPLQDLYRERQALLENRAMLASRLAAAATQLPALRARLTELRATASTSKITLDGANDAIASANLQSRIVGLAASLGVTVGSTETLAAEQRGGFQRIGLRVAVNGAFENLVRLFGAIEASVPPLILDNLHMHTAMQPPAMLGNVKLEAGLRSDASFEVYGIRGNETPVSVQR
jgi:general secretion pathway protein M